MRMPTVALSALLILCVSCSSFAQDLTDRGNLSDHLQNISVTVKAESSPGRTAMGSGVKIVRETTYKGEQTKVTFILTAAHVIANMRSTRTAIERGQSVTIVEFQEPAIIQELLQDGRKVGEVQLLTRVVKYSDASSGEDLAILMVYKSQVGTDSTRFFVEKPYPPLGTQLYHVGSLLGQVGANSMTSGIVSQVGRMQKVSRTKEAVFDQSTVLALPGSSGGGVFLTENEGEHAGKLVGLLTRGIGETFNFIVPTRRIKEWVDRNEMGWLLDDTLPVPSVEKILQTSVEADGILSPEKE